jgi:hypothetical protein
MIAVYSAMEPQSDWYTFKSKGIDNCAREERLAAGRPIVPQKNNWLERHRGNNWRFLVDWAEFRVGI